MSQKIDRLEPDIGVRGVHTRYGDIELLDKIMSITNSYWIIADADGELHMILSISLDTFYSKKYAADFCDS